MQHYVSLGEQGLNDRPWSSSFGEPTLVVSAEANPLTQEVHSGAWGYICPLLEDATTGNILEFCFAQWTSGAGFPAIEHYDVTAACASAAGHYLDQTITQFVPGTLFATEYTGSANTFIFKADYGWRHFIAGISRGNLENAITSTNKACEKDSPKYSTEPKNYALIGIEHGVEGGGLNEVGTSQGNLQLWTEYTALPPTVTTEAATGIQTTQATLNGRVNPNGVDTHYHFEYGPTTSYGSGTPEVDAGSGTNPVPGAAFILPLQRCTTYHYRMIASNSVGITYGGDESFNTEQPNNHTFYLSNSNAVPEENITSAFGNPCDDPLVGNWSGVGKNKENTFVLSNSNTKPESNIISAWGNLGDLHLAGDWTGQSKSTIGLYRPGTHEFILSNSNAQPETNIIATFGNPGDIPVVGDWFGQHKDTIGVYRPSEHTFYLSKANVNGGSEVIKATFGNPGDTPIVGDWFGQGKDTIGVYRPSEHTFYLSKANVNGGSEVIKATFGNPGDTPIVGDWFGQGKDTIGVYRPGTREFDLSKTNVSGGSEIIVTTWGSPGDTPIAGDWTGQGYETIGTYRDG